MPNNDNLECSVHKDDAYFIPACLKCIDQWKSDAEQLRRELDAVNRTLAAVVANAGGSISVDRSLLDERLEMSREDAGSQIVLLARRRDPGKPAE